MNLSLIKERFEFIKNEIHRINPHVTVIAATKTVPMEIMKQLSSVGITDAGENRVQEMLGKFGDGFSLNWHFIGQLQSNKVKYIINKTCMIHSVDRISLLDEIDKQAEKNNKIMPVLIEINVAGEEEKGGVPEERAEAFAESVLKYKNIRFEGLMAVPPNEKNISRLTRYYLQLSNIYDKLKKYGSVKYFSCGMSGDYRIAVEHGANMVRIGSAIFGNRTR